MFDDCVSFYRIQFKTVLNTGMKFKNIIMKTVLFLLLFSVKSEAQDTITIRGRVKDSVTREGISNVQVFIPKSTFGTTTNSSGGFSLTFKPKNSNITIVFRHIGYDSLAYALDRIQSTLDIYLMPRVIPLSEFEVSDKRVYSEIGKDLPQSILVIGAEEFEHLSFDDAGELLRNEQSIQVEETLNGLKTISIRGGNSSETIVMYNGIKLNSVYNNIADVSLIDLQDIEKVEVIRGSNTAIYGSEAFSGVINIVPKFNDNYHVRFRQKIGSYDSGQWTLNLNGAVGNLSGFLSTRQGASVRLFSTQNESNFQIRNNSKHFTGNFVYRLSDINHNNSLYGTVLTTTKDYENERDVETLSNEENIFSSRFDAYLPSIQEIEFKVSKRSFEQSHTIKSDFGSLTRNLSEESFNISIDKPIEIALVEQRFVYQLETTEFDISDIRGNDFTAFPGIARQQFNRTRHAIVSITKIHQKSRSDKVRVTDFDVSIRHEFLKDVQNETLSGSDFSKANNERNGVYEEETSYKFSYNIAGSTENTTYNSYMNYGTNFKFPSLSQRISSIYLKSGANENINFNPEKVLSKEIGFEIIGSLPDHEIVDEWEFKINIFNNIYDNKIRVTFPIGVPVPIYDNIARAKISGLETNLRATFYEKKLNMNIGLSKYFISDKSAFPFKYDMKLSMGITIKHSGYSSFITIYREGEQVGWINSDDEQLTVVILPSFSNIDIHISKAVNWNDYEMNINLSALNLISDDLIIQGLALRDRRYYLSVGIEY